MILLLCGARSWSGPPSSGKSRASCTRQVALRPGWRASSGITPAAAKRHRPTDQRAGCVRFRARDRGARARRVRRVSVTNASISRLLPMPASPRIDADPGLAAPGFAAHAAQRCHLRLASNQGGVGNGGVGTRVGRTARTRVLGGFGRGRSRWRNQRGLKDLLVEPLRRRLRFDAQLALQHGDADLVLPQRRAAPPLPRIQPHQRPVHRLLQRVEPEQSASRLNRLRARRRSWSGAPAAWPGPRGPARAGVRAPRPATPRSAVPARPVLRGSHPGRAPPPAPAPAATLRPPAARSAVDVHLHGVRGSPRRSRPSRRSTSLSSPGRACLSASSVCRRLCRAR